MGTGEAMAEVENLEGRLARLYALLAWSHVLEEHPELEPFLEDTVLPFKRPEHRDPDPRPGRERYYRRGGLLAWIRVVVDLARGHRLPARQ
jgi:hypothetical protein